MAKKFKAKKLKDKPRKGIINGEWTSIMNLLKRVRDRGVDLKFFYNSENDSLIVEVGDAPIITLFCSGQHYDHEEWQNLYDRLTDVCAGIESEQIH